MSPEFKHLMFHIRKMLDAVIPSIESGKLKEAMKLLEISKDLMTTLEQMVET